MHTVMDARGTIDKDRWEYGSPRQVLLKRIYPRQIIYATYRRHHADDSVSEFLQELETQ